MSYIIVSSVTALSSIRSRRTAALKTSWFSCLVSFVAYGPPGLRILRTLIGTAMEL